MKYKKEFIERVKSVYPDYKGMHELAEEGCELLGRYLDDNRKQGVDYNAVLAASTLDEVKEMAANIKAQNKLYSDFVSGNCYEWHFPFTLTETQYTAILKGVYSQMPDNIVVYQSENFKVFTQGYPFKIRTETYYGVRFLISRNSCLNTESECVLCEFDPIHIPNRYMNFLNALDKAFRQTSCKELRTEYIESQNNV